MAVFRKTSRKKTKPDEQELNNLLLSQDESGITSFVKDRPSLDPLAIARTMAAFKTDTIAIDPSISPLLTAVHCGEELIVNHLMEEGVDPDSGSLCGRGPLAVALETMHYKIARLLIECGADVNKFDLEGKAPMYHAIHENTPVFIIQDLLSAGVQKDAVIYLEENSTPLTIAVVVKNIAIVKLLLRKSVNVNCITADDNTPLNMAIINRSLQLTKLLITHGASVNGQNKGDVPPIFVASQTGDVGILKLLATAGAKISAGISLPEIGIPEPLIIRQSAFYFAVVNCSFDSVTFFLNNESNDNPIDSSDVKAALLFSFTINIHNHNQRKKNDHRKIIQLLLSKVEDINTLVNERPLLISNMITKKNWVALEECLRYGLDLNTCVDNEESCTIFQFVIVVKHLSLVELCLDLGADPSFPERKMPYHLAISTNDPAIFRAFLKRGHPFDEIPASLNIFSPMLSKVAELFIWHVEFFKCIACNSSDAVEYMLSLGAEVNSSSKEIKSLVHYCSGLEYTDILLILLKRGALPASLDSNGQTPLHIAAQNGYSKTCKLLLAHGACYNYSTSYGVTPISLARQGYDDETEKIFKLIHQCFQLVKKSDIRVVRILKTLSENENLRDEFLSCINCVNRKGNTLMGESIALEYFEIAREIMRIRIVSC